MRKIFIQIILFFLLVGKEKKENYKRIIISREIIETI